MLASRLPVVISQPAQRAKGIGPRQSVVARHAAGPTTLCHHSWSAVAAGRLRATLVGAVRRRDCLRVQFVVATHYEERKLVRAFSLACSAEEGWGSIEVFSRFACVPLWRGVGRLALANLYRLPLCDHRCSSPVSLHIRESTPLQRRDATKEGSMMKGPSRQVVRVVGRLTSPEAATP